jgi:hypothetical protein
MVVIVVPLDGVDRLVGQRVRYNDANALTRRDPGMQQAPRPEAPFADKMAYYRTQHTSKGVRATHLVGTPIIAAGLPLVFARPKVGAAMFEGGAGHPSRRPPVVREEPPSTHKGWITYQLTGVIHACEQYGEMLARRSQRKVGGSERVP